MKNNSTIFWQGQANVAMNAEAEALRQKNQAEMEGYNLAKEKERLQQEAQSNEIEAEDMAFLAYKLAKQAEALKAENDFYKSLLAKPMLDIANANKDFRNTYEAQQELLANWMVSQKAFKEIAIKYGIQAGKTKEEIVQEALTEGKSKVLNNETDYDNNAIDSAIITPYIDILKSKLK